MESGAGGKTSAVRAGTRSGDAAGASGKAIPCSSGLLPPNLATSAGCGCGGGEFVAVQNAVAGSGGTSENMGIGGGDALGWVLRTTPGC